MRNSLNIKRYFGQVWLQSDKLADGGVSHADVHPDGDKVFLFSSETNLAPSSLSLNSLHTYQYEANLTFGASFDFRNGVFLVDIP